LGNEFVECDECLDSGYGEQRDGDDIETYHCGCIKGKQAQWKDYKRLSVECEGSAAEQSRLAEKAFFFNVVYRCALMRY